MADNLSGRNDAPFSEAVWRKIDQIVTDVVRSQLTARRLLYVDGPVGMGFKAMTGPDHQIRADHKQGEVNVVSSEMMPVVDIESTFTLSARDIASFEQQGAPLDAGAIANAAIILARKEDDILFNGIRELGTKGLTNAAGVQTIQLESWNNIGTPINNIIGAVNRHDGAGFHGPYTLALAPTLYNSLFRLYPQGNLTEFQHLQTFITDGIIKSGALSSGGVLLASGRQFASIVLGQDIITGFVGPQGRSFEFVISESLTLRLIQPAAVVVLQSA